MNGETRLVMLGTPPGTHGSIAAVVEAYRAHGLFKRWPVDYIATHGAGSLREDAALALRAVRRFGLLLGQHRGAVVHLHVTARTGLWRQCLFAALGAATGAPLIVQLHGGGFQRLYDGSGTPARTAIRLLLERAACVLVPSDSLRTWVRNLVRNARVAALPVPVPLHPAASRARPAGVVLYLGRLDEGRGVMDLLEALAALRQAVPEARLVCAGEGERAALARHAARLGIADAVKFTGWVGPSGKRALLESASAFALPAYSEGLPVSLLEAMSAGVPAVAAQVGGIPEVLVDGVSGFLVAPGDVAALARQLRRLLEDPALAARIGRAGSESVRLRFAPERAIPRLEEVYANAGLAAAGAPPLRMDERKAA